MPIFDLPLEELESYLPAREEPADFDEFWRLALEDVRSFPLDASFKPVDFGLQAIETFDVTFNGYGGQPIKGWLMLPKNRSTPLPCIVEYMGYGGGRGFPLDWLLWSNIGFAHLVMDSRGQGSDYLHGDTPDLSPEGSSPQYPGFATRGILDPNTYYYKRVFTDAIRAVEVAQEHSAVDSKRIAVSGLSQGGGVSLAVSGLVPEVAVILPDVPFLCHFRRAISITTELPYAEIQYFCKAHRDKVEIVFNTLSYFDGINFAVRASAKAFFSVGLMDEICPPSTVFAAYNHYAGPKEIKVWEYNNHEGGGSHQTLEKVEFLTNLWK